MKGLRASAAIERIGFCSVARSNCMWNEVIKIKMEKENKSTQISEEESDTEMTGEDAYSCYCVGNAGASVGKMLPTQDLDWATVIAEKAWTPFLPSAIVYQHDGGDFYDGQPDWDGTFDEPLMEGPDLADIFEDEYEIEYDDEAPISEMSDVEDEKGEAASETTMDNTNKN